MFVIASPILFLYRSSILLCGIFPVCDTSTFSQAIHKEERQTNHNLEDKSNRGRLWGKKSYHFDCRQVAHREKSNIVESTIDIRRKMAVAVQTSNQLMALFDENVRQKTAEVYHAVPASLIKFLDKREVIKKVKFAKYFSADQVTMGTKKKVNFADFENSLRNTINESFRTNRITEVRAEDISGEISRQYQRQAPERANAGEKISANIRFDLPVQKKLADVWTNVNAYVYIHIKEECEDNWFAEDKRKFSYELTLELNGLAVNTEKAIKFGQMVTTKSVQDTVAYLETNYAIKWEDI